MGKVLKALKKFFIILVRELKLTFKALGKLGNDSKPHFDKFTKDFGEWADKVGERERAREKEQRKSGRSEFDFDLGLGFGSAPPKKGFKDDKIELPKIELPEIKF